MKFNPLTLLVAVVAVIATCSQASAQGPIAEALSGPFGNADVGVAAPFAQAASGCQSCNTCQSCNAAPAVSYNTCGSAPAASFASPCGCNGGGGLLGGGGGGIGGLGGGGFGGGLGGGILGSRPLLGLGVVGGIVAIAVSDDDDDDEASPTN